MSAAPTRRAISQALLGGVLVLAAGMLAFRSGGFYDEPRATLAIGAWALVFVVALVPGELAVLPRTWAARIALLGLVGLAGWTAVSLLWAPLIDPARDDVMRVALYAAALPLAVAAFRQRPIARLLEPALALLAFVVVGYGVLGDIGAIDVSESLSADGRLAEPLGYWNAMGAMAALGVVLCARIAIDATRARGLRGAGAVALVPLALGLYLTYSRGALAAAALGLVVLALLAPELGTFWRRAGSRWRLGVGWGAVATLVVALAVVAGDRASPPARGATAERFADIGSNRADYWRVAASSFAENPLAGVGSAGFRVEWLREREVQEGTIDAHSLALETGAELGAVGLLLLGAFAGGTALCTLRLVRRDPALAAGPAAALALLALHASIDWDWEMPALALPALMLAGLVLAADGPIEREAVQR